MMGWSSWNTFRVHINEELIKETADAMVNRGLKDVGYGYVNIDDGYFGGRNSEGRLFANKKKFPNGMRVLSDYIHSKGLKAGIYSDAGSNTCGSIYDADTLGIGVGLWKHDDIDCQTFLKDWGYDFIKIDWCGGEATGQPLFVAAFGMARGVLLKRFPDPGLLLTIAAGFIGVLLVMRPGGADGSLPFIALGLFSGLCSAATGLTLRKLGSLGEPIIRTVTWFAIGCLAAGIVMFSLFSAESALSLFTEPVMLAIGLTTVGSQLAQTQQAAQRKLVHAPT